MANQADTAHSDAGDAGLRAAIERSGYNPALVAESMSTAIGSERVSAHLVHQETTFDGDEVCRHVTVLAITTSRLVVGHTDEFAPDETSTTSYATTSTETVWLDRVSSVVVSRVVDEPASYKPGTPPREVVVTIGWGAVGRLDLEPASCGDPHCEADHGYSGTFTADDLSLRVSAAADGAEQVAATLAFAASLADATAPAAR